MKVNFTNNWEQCVYDRDVCRIIKDRGCSYHPSGYSVTPEEFEAMKGKTFYAIWGSDIPEDITFGCNEKVNPEVAYVFFRNEKGLHPIRVTYSRKTLANFARQERKFGHLRPENEPDNF